MCMMWFEAAKKLQDYEWRNNLKAILASFDYNMNYEFKM